MVRFAVLWIREINCDQLLSLFKVEAARGISTRTSFLADGKRILPALPVFEKFEALQQVSAKNKLQAGLFMEFSGQELGRSIII